MSYFKNKGKIDINPCGEIPIGKPRKCSDSWWQCFKNQNWAFIILIIALYVNACYQSYQLGYRHGKLDEIHIEAKHRLEDALKKLEKSKLEDWNGRTPRKS